MTEATVHPLAEIREGQERSKPEWSAVIREAILRELMSNRDGFHADALVPLGIPDECKNLVGSQIARLVNEKWITDCGRRKSTVPSRNGGKSFIYRFTALGWQSVGVDVGEDVCKPVQDGVRAASRASVDPDGRSTGGRGEPSTSIPRAANATPGAAPSEPLSLLPDDVGQAPPLHPLTSVEAA